ncbi:hypothetical protein D3C86_2075030 [compost metagenome]
MLLHVLNGKVRLGGLVDDISPCAEKDGMRLRIILRRIDPDPVDALLLEQRVRRQLHNPLQQRDGNPGAEG